MNSEPEGPKGTEKEPRGDPGEPQKSPKATFWTTFWPPGAPSKIIGFIK